MDMTPELKAEIDSQSFQDLLRRWRFSPVGDPIFQGESGECQDHEQERKKEKSGPNRGKKERLEESVLEAQRRRKND